MDTKRRTKLVRRMKDSNKTWKAIVINREDGFELTTPFNSENHELENVLHKVELDLMTNLHLGIKKPIQIYISDC
jgi:hypothetical protein